MARETAANHCDANFGELRRSTERRKATIEFFIALACVFVTVRCLIHPARTLYRWDIRPHTLASDDLLAEALTTLGAIEVRAGWPGGSADG